MAGLAAEQWLAGGIELRRRRSGVGGRATTCRGASLDHEEASLGVNLCRGGAGSRAPRRPTEERRPWRRRGCSGRREGARVGFLGARGKSGGARVRLGANEGGESLGRGGTRGSGRSADGGELWCARRGSGPFKTSQGRRGRRVGVSVARGIEGRPRSAARAGAWPGSFGATAASRRIAERSSCVACSSTEQKVSSVAGSTGWEGKSAGRAREALMAGQYSPGWRSNLR